MKEGNTNRFSGIRYLFIEEVTKFSYDYFNVGDAWWRRRVIV